MKLHNPTVKSAGCRPLQGMQEGRKPLTKLEMKMDYFDYTGPISPPKEITEKESPGLGNKSIKEKHEILIKIKTKEWCGNEELMEIARKYGKVKRLKMDIENPSTNSQIFYIKYEQREEMDRAQIKLKEEEIISEITAMEEQRVNMTNATNEQYMYNTCNNEKLTKIEKPARWILLWYKEGRKNHMKAKT